MTLRDFFDNAIRVGMDHDPRGAEVVQRTLDETRKRFDKMDDQKKEFFDTEKLTNPFADSRLLVGPDDTPLESLMVGIDLDGTELVVADRLRQKGRTVSAALSHHPRGTARPGLPEVMGMQVDILEQLGVAVNVVESLMDDRIKEVSRRLAPTNHTQAQDVARLLEIPYLCLHTPADNMVTSHLQSTFERERPWTLDDVVELLMEIPEYRHGRKMGSGPQVLIGSGSRRAGKVFVDMTGGTGGSTDIFDRLAASGVGTIVGMHLGEEHRKKATAAHINVVIAGHIASDTLGMNLLLDEVLPEGVEIIECSGFVRVDRRTG